jgi:hypothetical protein
LKSSIKEEFEWKINFGLWTAVAALTGFLYNGNYSINLKDCANWVLPVAYFLILCISIGWNVFVFRANSIDQKFERMYRKKIEKEININQEFKQKNNLKSLRCYVPWLQSLTTLIFLLTSFFLLIDP